MSRRIASLVLSCLLLTTLAAAEEPPAKESAPDAPVVAYYLHRTLRCQTCLTIESLARYDIDTEMTAEVESGRLAWRLVNFEEPGHAHFVEDFALTGPSLVLARYVDGKVAAWERLDRAWELYGDVEAFDRYVLGAVERFLDAASED